MKKNLVVLAIMSILVASFTSCKPSDEQIENSLAGYWDYTADISWNFTDYQNGQQQIVGSKKINGWFDWSRKTNGGLDCVSSSNGKDIEGYVIDGTLIFYNWSETWTDTEGTWKITYILKNVEASKDMKYFSTTYKDGTYAVGIELTRANGSTCSGIPSCTFTARKR